MKRTVSIAGLVERALFDDEVIEAAVISPQRQPDGPWGEVLTWEEARPHLTGEFVQDWGECGDVPAVRVWTNKRVLFTHDYDSKVSVQGVWRNPTAGYVEHVS